MGEENKKSTIALSLRGGFLKKSDVAISGKYRQESTALRLPEGELPEGQERLPWGTSPLAPRNDNAVWQSQAASGSDGSISIVAEGGSSTIHYSLFTIPCKQKNPPMVDQTIGWFRAGFWADARAVLPTARAKPLIEREGGFLPPSHFPRCSNPPHHFVVCSCTTEKDRRTTQRLTRPPGGSSIDKERRKMKKYLAL